MFAILLPLLIISTSMLIFLQGNIARTTLTVLLGHDDTTENFLKVQHSQVRIQCKIYFYLLLLIIKNNCSNQTAV